MKKKVVIALAVLSLMTTTWQSLPAYACVFASQPYFTYTSHPDFPLKKYAAGQLGILDSGYARSYLLCAYRYLSGAPLSGTEQDTLVKLWDDRLLAGDTSCGADTKGWLQARSTIAGAGKIDNIDTERPVSKDESWQVYCNCQTDAFETAAKTLKQLSDKFGPESTAVKDWLAAQDQVFSNCGYPLYVDNPKPAVIPAPLPSNADVSLQKDRSYQIAAANFYAQNFDVARRQFESIAGDKDSPWQQIAGYLAVRAMIRQASLSKQLDTALLEEAEHKLQQLSRDPAYASLSVDLVKLESFIAARLHPEQHLHELVAQAPGIATGNFAEITKTIDNILPDRDDQSNGLQYAKLPDSLKSQDVIDWVITFQSADDAAKHHAIERWKQTHSVPWLVAAIAAIDVNDADCDTIFMAASRENSQSARWTLFYHINRLNLAKGKIDVVRQALDKVLDNQAVAADLPPGSLNELKKQRLVLARNLGEIVRFGVQAPLPLCSNGGVEEVPDDVEQIEKTGKFAKQIPEFTAEAGDILDNKLPLSLLKQLASNKQLPRQLQNDVAWTAWVRAVLIGDEPVARELAQIMRPFNKAKEKLIDAYLAAPTPEARKFAAAFLMLRFSSAQPNPMWGPLSGDGYGDDSGWWWSAHPIQSNGGQTDGSSSSKTIEKLEPLFLTAEQRAEAKQQLAKLAAIETAPDFLARIVLAFAKAHPQDERVPQALHLVVKATRYGVTDAATGTLSKQAFTLLHTRYKASPWTDKTPYWY